MSSKEPAEDYLKRAKLRFKILNEFFEKNDYADVMRISEEIVELSQRSILSY
ncbi:hypothetical protein [Thermodesulfovibrio yellowstonii]|uniref:HEPN domain-containing protein n=1 Tax=Thermodesulfovibrio yellowstonii TaxID=28262 RepID=A0A9W6LJ69_9BACT|nr:hypothetical protein [Thermodesulfovibrio islandicus]GLI52397.1 hypothetical protein TISLANDTSLP1_00900 [Thermodesulfovibrio islandicus]